MLNPIRQIKRDWNNGEVKIMAFTLLFAITSLTFLNLFNYRLEQAIYYQGGAYLGADMIHISSREIDPAILAKSRESKISDAQAIAFSTVLMANDEFILAHIKAVDSAYPLLGSINIIKEKQLIESNKGPAENEIWLSSRLLSHLKVKPGDKINVGFKSLLISAELKHDPGQVNSFLSFAPKALMHVNDLQESKIIQPGSRISYQTGFSGNKTSLAQFEQWLIKQIDNTQKIIGGQLHNSSVSKALQKTSEFLGLANILSLILSGIAIAMCSQLFVQRQQKQIAIIRCLGASQTAIVRLYLTELLILALPVSILGLLSGWLLEKLLIAQLAELIPPQALQLSSANIVISFVIASLTGIITLLFFSLPAFIHMIQMPANQILQQQHNNKPLNKLLLPVMSFVYVLLFSGWQTGQWIIALKISLVLMICLLFFLYLSVFLGKFSQALKKLFKGNVKLGLQQVHSHSQSSTYQIFALSITVILILSFFELKVSLVDSWQDKLPEKTPNYFLINIHPDQYQQINHFMQQNQLQSQGLFPIVRGRISAINEKNIDQLYPDWSTRDNSLKRELNLSWTEQLPLSNQIVQGIWHNDTANNELTVSIEKGVANRMGLTLGDTLQIDIGGDKVSSKISSIRTLEWDSFQPNFYLLFRPGALDGFPVNYMSSFYLADNQKHLIKNLIQKFPALTVLDLDDLIKQMQKTFDQLVKLLNTLFVFLLFSTVFVVIASIISSQDERYKTMQLMNTLGATKEQINSANQIESLIVAVFIIFLSIAGSLLLVQILNLQIFGFLAELKCPACLLFSLLIIPLLWIINRFFLNAHAK